MKIKQFGIKQIFDDIAFRYDEINNIISLGLHKHIKKSAVKLLNLKTESIGLDLCTGTGDIISIIKKMFPDSNIIGVDNSDNMLNIAKKINPNFTFINADCTQLPFEDNQFDFITMSFGLRNIIDRTSALNEIYRVLKNEGIFLHLDFGEQNILNKIFDIYTPFIVKILKENPSNYEYLINSKNSYPKPNVLIREFENHNFDFVTQKKYLFGSLYAIIMKKHFKIR